jgi:hypothetical protein
MGAPRRARPRARTPGYRRRLGATLGTRRARRPRTKSDVYPDTRRSHQSIGTRPLESAGLSDTTAIDLRQNFRTPTLLDSRKPRNIRLESYASCTSLSLSAILVSSLSDLALILRVKLLRWTFTVVSLMPNSPAICLLSRPRSTWSIISRSRGLSVSEKGFLSRNSDWKCVPGCVPYTPGGRRVSLAPH